MEELSGIAKGGIGAAFAIVAAIAYLWIRARQNRVETDDAKRAALEAELAEAVRAHRAHLRGGDAIGANREKRRINRIRAKLGYKKKDESK